MRTRQSSVKPDATIRKIRKEGQQLAKKLVQVSEAVVERSIAKHVTRTAPAGKPLTEADMAKYSKAHTARRTGITANALAAVPASYLAENRSVIQGLNYTYSDTLARCPGATSQSNSGRCWLFAALNAMRYYIIKNLNLNDYFELSEAYLFFFDKIERGGFFLEKMVELRDRPLTDPVLFGLLHVARPVEDGGTFGFFKNLIAKYGIVPKSSYGEGFNSLCTDEMNDILWRKLTGFAYRIRTSGLPAAALRATIKNEMLPEIYSLMVRFLGEPPGNFTWSYHESGDSVESVRDKGVYHSLPGLTPRSFYETYVVPYYNPEAKVVLRHDPRPTSRYNQVYSSNHHGHMIGAPPTVAFNVDLPTLKKAVADSIGAEQPVWFACDVGQDFNPEHSLLSTEAFDYAGLFQTEFMTDKAQMLDMGASGPTHAMLIVGVDRIDRIDRMEADRADRADRTEAGYNKWRVENSWGEWPGEDPGYLQMSDAWFDRYVYEVVVNLDLLPEKLQKTYQALEYKPVLLDYNDPFGAVSIK